MGNGAEAYIAAVAGACQAAGLRVEGHDAGGTRVRGGSIDLRGAGAGPAGLLVLGWDEEAGWFAGREDGTGDGLTDLRFFGGEVLPPPAVVLAAARSVLGGDMTVTRRLVSRYRTAGARDGLDAGLAAYAATGAGGG